MIIRLPDIIEEVKERRRIPVSNFMANDPLGMKYWDVRSLML